MSAPKPHAIPRPMNMFTQIASIAAGGALGSVARYALSSQLAEWIDRPFPWPILIVNVLGSFAMGVIVQVGVLKLGLPLEVRTFLTAGFLGGFTTFSAFALDSVVLMDRGDVAGAVFYVAASVLGSIAALFLGLALVRGVVS